MKNPILLLLAIFSIMPSFSTERDTTVIFNQKEILIKDSSEIVSVTTKTGTNTTNIMNHAILTGKNKPLGNFPNPYRFPFQI